METGGRYVTGVLLYHKTRVLVIQAYFLFNVTNIVVTSHICSSNVVYKKRADRK
jgi:hypothetical protein